MIDASYLKVQRMAAGLLKKEYSRHIGRTKGGLSSKPNAVCDLADHPEAQCWPGQWLQGRQGDFTARPKAKKCSRTMVDGNYNSGSSTPIFTELRPSEGQRAQWPVIRMVFMIKACDHEGVPCSSASNADLEATGSVTP